MSDQVVYIGVIRPESKHIRPEDKLVLAASIFASGAKLASLDKISIERHFAKVASNADHKVPGFREHTNINKYYVYVIYDEKNDHFFAAAAPHTFNGRVAYETLYKARDEVARCSVDLSTVKALGLNNVLRETFLKLMVVAKDDKMMNAQNRVTEVKVHMSQNLRQATANLETMEELDAKARDLEGDTKNYQLTTVKLKDQQRRAYYCMWLQTGGLCLLFFVFCLWFFGAFRAIK